MTADNWSVLDHRHNGDHLIDGTACTVSGSGPVVVLIHGVGLDRTLWDEHAHNLSRNYCVIRHDLPGHGESSPAPSGATLDDFADQLVALLDAFGVERAAVAGFSLGAITTQNLMVRYPQRLARVALLYSVYNRGEESLRAIAQRVEQAQREGTRSLIDAALARWFSDAFREANPEIESRVRQRLLDNNPEHFLVAYKIFASSNVSISDTIDAQRVPTLVMTGELDPGSTPAMSRAIADDIPGARLVVLKGQRHMGVVEATEETVRYLREWLAS